jgi:hypothetical protein
MWRPTPPLGSRTRSLAHRARQRAPAGDRLYGTNEDRSTQPPNTAGRTPAKERRGGVALRQIWSPSPWRSCAAAFAPKACPRGGHAPPGALANPAGELRKIEWSLVLLPGDMMARWLRCRDSQVAGLDGVGPSSRDSPAGFRGQCAASASERREAACPLRWGLALHAHQVAGSRPAGTE